MRWPSDQDYNEAVQNPKSAFEDVELQSGVVESYPTGIPKARSGNFAAVYKVKANGGQWAVKCFRYENPEYSRRYPAISAHLSINPLPYFVSFRYLSQGIRVGGVWYPILKMKWVEGESLIPFIERNLNSPATLRNLSASWIRLLTDLQAAGMAHGDLQHGNVLVVGGNLKLVDYDGMYVPALEGCRPLERGHSNYQHPERTDLDFGPFLDNFSAWLVYISLVALSVQPGLWSQLKSGDECLLFRKQDLAAPDQSEVFRLLRAIPDKTIRHVIDRLEEFLWLPLSKIPPVSNQLEESKPSQVDTVPIGLADWITDYVQPRRSSSSTPPSEGLEAGEIGDPSWIQDHVEATVEAVLFQNQVGLDRLVALGLYLSATLFASWLSWDSGVVSAGIDSLVSFVSATASVLLFWFLRFRRESAYRGLRLVGSELREATRAVQSGESTHEELKKKRTNRRIAYSAELLNVENRHIAFQTEEAKEIARIENELNSSLRQAHQKKRVLGGEEANEKRLLADKSTVLSYRLSTLDGQKQIEMNQVDLTIGSAVKNLETQLDQLLTKTQLELRQALKNYQDQIVLSHLHKRRIADATITGIGEELKQRLAQAGYLSAADVVVRQVSVPGIGAKKRSALHTWVLLLDKDIRQREAPHTLPAHTAANIEQRHTAPIGQLRNSLAQERARLASARDGINNKYGDEKRLLEAQLRIEEGTVKQQTKIIEAKFEALRAGLTNKEEQARLQSECQIADCKKKFRSMICDVNAETDRLKKGYMSDLEGINNELSVSARHVRQMTWRREQASQKNAAYKRFTFRCYCIRVLSRGRS